MTVSFSLARSVAAVAAVGFVLVAGYQACLALAVIPGSAAWGGQHDVLPMELRLACGRLPFYLQSPRAPTYIGCFSLTRPRSMATGLQTV